MKAKNFILALAIVLPLIGLGAYATLPASKLHVLLHQNWFERTGYTDENAEVELPFEVMLGEFSVEGDTTVNVQLFVQPMGNAEPENIEIFNLEPLQTESYQHCNFYIEEYRYDDTTGKLQMFLIVEQLHYQLWLSWLGL